MKWVKNPARMEVKTLLGIVWQAEFKARIYSTSILVIYKAKATFGEDFFLRLAHIFKFP